MGRLDNKAKRLRSVIEAAMQTVDEETALSAVELFPLWDAARTYTAADRVQHGGTLYRCLQAHTAQSDWAPGAAPSLWAEILPGQSGTEIGEWQQPSSTNPYSKGDKVTYNGKTYVSTIDGNVWAPTVYGWQEVN